MAKEQDYRAEARERAKAKAQGGRFKLVEGENTIRILPTPLSSKSSNPKVFFEYLTHREVGPKKRFVRCGKDMKGGGECWLCDAKIPKLTASKSRADRAQAESIKAIEQFAVQVAVLDQDSGKLRGPFLWHVSTGGGKSLAAQLLRVLQSTKRDYVSLKKGYNLTIDRTGTGMTDTRYGAPVPDEEPTAVSEAISAKMKPFSELIAKYSEEDQKAAITGRDAAARDEEDEEEELDDSEDEAEETDDDEEAEEEAPKKKGKKKVADEDEDEAEEEEAEETDDEEAEEEEATPADEDEDEDEAEEEEDATPAPKKQGKKKPPADVEDEDETPAPKRKRAPVPADIEVEDEDEAPAPKKKGKKKPSDDDDEETGFEPDESDEEEVEEARPKKKGKK